jgi:hypothetical protein
MNLTGSLKIKISIVLYSPLLILTLQIIQSELEEIMVDSDYPDLSCVEIHDAVNEEF